MHMKRRGLAAALATLVILIGLSVTIGSPAHAFIITPNGTTGGDGTMGQF